LTVGRRALAGGVLESFGNAGSAGPERSPARHHAAFVFYEQNANTIVFITRRLTSSRSSSASPGAI